MIVELITANERKQEVLGSEIGIYYYTVINTLKFVILLCVKFFAKNRHLEQIMCVYGCVCNCTGRVNIQSV